MPPSGVASPAAGAQNHLDDLLSPALATHPVWLTFFEKTDESVYTTRQWMKSRRQVQLSLLLQIFLLLILLFGMFPSSAYRDSILLLLLSFGVFVPSIIIVAWSFALSPKLCSLWSPVAAFLMSVVVSSLVGIVARCAAVNDQSHVLGCDSLEAAQIPWLPVSFMMLLPYYMFTVLRVRWDYMLASSFAVAAVVIGVCIAFSVEDSLPLGGVAIINLFTAVVSSWTAQRDAQREFKQVVSLRRKLASVVFHERSKLVAQEAGQRVFELIKRSSHMILEFNDKDVIMFVSPACRTLLGFETEELLNQETTCSALTMPEDAEMVKSCLAKLRRALDEHEKHACIRFRRRRKNGQPVLVEMNAYVIHRTGLPAAILATEHVLAPGSGLQPGWASDNRVVEHDATESGLQSERQTLFRLLYEMRIPITAANASVQALLVKARESPLDDELGGVQLDLEQLRALITYAQAWSHRPYSELPTSLATVQLRMLMERFAQQFRHMSPAHPKGDVVLLNITPGVPDTIEIDSVLFVQCLGNIVWNAINAAPAGQVEVRVKVGRSPSFFYVEVADQGHSEALTVKDQLNNMPIVSHARPTKAMTMDSRMVQSPDDSRPGVPEQKSGADLENQPKFAGRRLGLGNTRAMVEMLKGVITISRTDAGLLVAIELPVRSSITAAPRDVSVSRPAIDANKVPGAGTAIAAEESPEELPQRPAPEPSTLPTVPTGAAEPVAGRTITPRIEPTTKPPLATVSTSMSTATAGPQAIGSAAAAAAAAVAATATSGPGPAAGMGLAAGGDGTAQQEHLGLHVLLVDDERINRRLGARMLDRLGCTFELLDDGDQVMGALAKGTKFDAILMDIFMQRSDGAEVCKQLRDQGCALPIIAMTGNTTFRDVQRFMAAGFDLVLPKPFDIKAMGRALTESRARRNRGADASASAAARPSVDGTSA